MPRFQGPSPRQIFCPSSRGRVQKKAGPTEQRRTEGARLRRSHSGQGEAMSVFCNSIGINLETEFPVPVPGQREYQSPNLFRQSRPWLSHLLPPGMAPFQRVEQMVVSLGELQQQGRNCSRVEAPYELLRFLALLKLLESCGTIKG